MSEYAEDLAREGAIALRPWILPAFGLSLLLHAGLLYYFSVKKLDQFTSSDTPRLVPRTFNVSRVQIDQKLVQSDSKEAPQPGKLVADLAKPQDLNKIDDSFEKDMREMRATPDAVSTEVPELQEKPNINAQSAAAALAKAKAESAQAIEKELSEVRQQLLFDKPDVPSRPKLASGNRRTLAFANVPASGDSALSDNANVPAGFSNLDQLLSSPGKVGNSTAPILLPTDLLFDYDSATLRSGATASLQKLGRIIQRNPDATFKVEGHTDSFGSDAYNMDLSQRRAETVKQWLVENMAIDASRIQTQGFGKTRLLVPGARSVEEQQLNRRVEIVIRTKKS